MPQVIEFPLIMNLMFDGAEKYGPKEFDRQLEQFAKLVGQEQASLLVARGSGMLGQPQHVARVVRLRSSQRRRVRIPIFRRNIKAMHQKN